MRILVTLTIAFLLSQQLIAQDKSVSVHVPDEIKTIISNRCLDCHGDTDPEGDLRLDNISEVTGGLQFSLLDKIEQQVYLQEMPPAEAESLTQAESETIFAWIKTSNLSLKRKSGFREKLATPNYANYIDHDLLFSGEVKAKAYTPARRWLISEYIFNQMIAQHYGMTERDLQGKKIRLNVANPFVSSSDDAIQYYSNGVLSGNHVAMIINNASWMSDKQLRATMIELGQAKIRKEAIGGDRYAEEWLPETPEAFDKLLRYEGTPPDALLKEAITLQFNRVLRREPHQAEMSEYLQYLKSCIAVGGKAKGLQQVMIAVWLEEELYYRYEFGDQQLDEFGRKKLTPNEAATAIAFALSDVPPDEELRSAAQEGRLTSKEDYKREILRLLSDTTDIYPVGPKIWHGRFETTNPRVHRFFREFFDYASATSLFKDNNRYFGDYRKVAETVVKEADVLIAHRIQEDEQVFEKLIGSEEFFVYHDGDNELALEKVQKLEEVQAKLLKRIEGLNWQENPREAFIEAGLFKPTQKEDSKSLKRDQSKIKSLLYKIEMAQEAIGSGKRPIPFRRTEKELRAPHLFAWNIDHHNWDYEPIQPVAVANRKGILTHPAWLIAHSKNTENDPVKRGHWILERLLAGRVPEIPIGVEAKIPEDPHKTLRARLEVATEKETCLRCHQSMNPLGLPFESFDDFGRYRTEEALEHPENILVPGTQKPNRPNVYKTLPVNARGHLAGTNDPSLDGEVKDAFDLIDRLAKSDRVRQSIIRHAFRYFMGRNEMLSDSQALIDADQAYQKSNGSFKAVIVSLLTSDSFMYRKDVRE